MRYWSCFAVGTALAGIIAACGGSDGTSVFGDPNGDGGPGGGGVDGSIDSAGQILNPGDHDTGPGPVVGTCTPRTCAQAGVNCGPTGDGCGGVIQCGSCKAPQSCGGGGTASQCGGDTGCKPRTCASEGVNCGPLGDGCGDLVPSCGTCTSPQICGGGGQPSVCGGNAGTDSGTCVVTVTCPAGGCGPIADGCGGLLQCGACVAPQTCGAGGVSSVCGGTNACMPQTVCPAGSCGPIADGCGALIAGCNNGCAFGRICGGGGVPSQCGSSSDGGADAGPCTGLCQNQVKCDGGATTTITGTVYAPNGVEPLPNAVVYVPNGGPAPTYGVLPFTPGVACNQCGADITGSPLVKAFTNFDGTFTLPNVPVMANMPLVVQLGRWRRQVTIPTVTQCGTTAVTATLTRLPRNKAEGDIPLTAIALGKVDSLECVLRKIGISDTEFTAAGGTGRIQTYMANGANSPSWIGATGLIDNLATLKNHDLVLLPCEGFDDYAVVNASTPPNPTGVSTRQQAMIDYANAGGRVYGTHYSYTWLANGLSGPPPVGAGPLPFSTTANFNLDRASNDTGMTGDVDISFPKGQVFAKWLGVVNALLPPANPLVAPTIGINVSRHDMTSVIAPSQSWITVDPSPATGYTGETLHYTFNTPTTALPANQCGRVLFSDFHVSNAATNGLNFPVECGNSVNIRSSTNASPINIRTSGAHGFVTGDVVTITGHTVDTNANGTWTIVVIDATHFTLTGSTGNGTGGQTGQVTGPPGALTAQEKVLEFMLFDLANCITPDNPPSCTPKTCAPLACGPAGDGCGGTLQCGACVAPAYCGGGGPSQCGSGACVPKTCAGLGFNCGLAGDGCGGSLDCGTCATNMNCGATSPNMCGVATCTPKTCAQLGLMCGPAGDGCGGLLDCGPCVMPDTCGGGGIFNMCGHPTCTPRTCAQAGANCGPIADGCGSLVQCGTCVGPETCGGGGLASVCGGGPH